MSTNLLHLVNKSPFQSQGIWTCLRVASQDSAILFLEDGVYALRQGTPTGRTLSSRSDSLRLYVLNSDLTARGMLVELLVPKVTVVDDIGFVDLVVAHRSVHSWF